MSGIGEFAADPHGAGAGIDTVFDEIDESLQRVIRSHCPAPSEWHLVLASAFELAFADQLQDFEHRLFVDVEIHIHRVFAEDAREPGLIRGHQIAHRDLFAADHAADRCEDFGPREVELGSVDRRYALLTAAAASA